MCAGGGGGLLLLLPDEEVELRLHELGVVTGERSCRARRPRAAVQDAAIGWRRCSCPSVTSTKCIGGASHNAYSRKFLCFEQFLPSFLCRSNSIHSSIADDIVLLNEKTHPSCFSVVETYMHTFSMQEGQRSRGSASARRRTIEEEELAANMTTRGEATANGFDGGDGGAVVGKQSKVVGKQSGEADGIEPSGARHRNRASPARLFKLNKELILAQKGVIIGKEFGGLLDLAASSMLGDLSEWILKHYDPEMSQIVIPERGKILVDVSSIRRIWVLPNRGRKVCFDNCPDITREMYNMYNITFKYSPTLTTWCKMIKDMNGAHDDDFLRAWLALVFSSFLVSSTSLSISPKSFPPIMDVNGITETNICQFVVEQLKLAFT
ncbi:hypothetical protein ZWY2020_050260 [Hordeum vulgare]|nr:hypothetical protein ZWY2020_050260 [Hordeum vulgare]